MRNAGTQLPRWTAAFIPLSGVVLEAIDPANLRGVMGIIAQKETQQKSRAGTRVILKQRRGHCHRDSEMTLRIQSRKSQVDSAKLALYSDSLHNQGEAMIFTDDDMVEGRDCIEFLLLRLDEKFPAVRGMALCALWASGGVIPDEILKGIEEKKYPQIAPDFYDKNGRPRLLLSSIAKILGIEQRLIENGPHIGNDSFRSAADFIHLTGQKYADAEGDMRKMYLLAWHDFYENAPESLKKIFDEKFAEIFGIDFSKMQPVGWDEHGTSVFSLSEVAKALGISEAEAFKHAKEFENLGISVAFSMPEPNDGKVH